ncbi:nuclear transport factor 2 family protein [Kitasatospora sp. NPDC057015]|uniref:nuclear transport factor 2 family protein n=1 Tax=Kitasatospora sp. NPDC057015 TaxID=3346001 RepID=UPI00362DF657
MTQELTFHQEVQIRSLFALFAHVFDNGEVDALGQVFTEDGVIELARTGSVFRGLDAIRAFNRNLGANSPDHHTLDTVLSVDQDGTVRARSRYLAVLPDGSVHNGDYFDVLALTAQGWRIAHRRSVPRYPLPGLG